MWISSKIALLKNLDLCHDTRSIFSSKNINNIHLCSYKEKHTKNFLIGQIHTTFSYVKPELVVQRNVADF